MPIDQDANYVPTSSWEITSSDTMVVNTPIDCTYATPYVANTIAYIPRNEDAQFTADLNSEAVNNILNFMTASSSEIYKTDIRNYEDAMDYNYDEVNSIRITTSVMKKLVEEIKRLQERNNFLEAQNEKTLEQIWDKIVN